jgi:hypothetical protein
MLARVSRGSEKMTENEVKAGDIVMAPGDNLGIVVGIYGIGYCEVLINKGTNRARVIPYRAADLRRIPYKPTASQ